MTTFPCNTALAPRYTHAVRVSSAQARGAAKAYAYWGAVTYYAARRRDGVWTWRATGRAGSDRRSVAAAERDAEATREALRAKGRSVDPCDVRPGERVELWDPYACTSAAGAARCA
jgi:hypothetical protein